MRNLLRINPFATFWRKYIPHLTLFHFGSTRVRIDWSIGAFRNVFLKLKSTLGLVYVFLRTPKLAPKKLIINVVEMQNLSDIEKTDSKE